MTLLIKAEDLRGLLKATDAIDAVEDAFRSNADNPAFGPTHTRLHADGRRATIQPGGSLVHRTAGAFLHYERLNFGTAAQGYLGVGRRLYAVYDTESAELIAIILGSLPLFGFDPPDAFGTETAITSAVGTRLLARKDSRIMALIGTGRQAARHLDVMARLFPLSEVRVFSRDPANRTDFCARMAAHVDIELRSVVSADAAVEGADLVICASSSNVPVLNGAALGAGAHVTSIVNGNKIVVRPGEPPRYRREIDDETVRRADVICAVMRAQAVQDGQGDLSEPVEKGIIGWDDVRDLDQILSGRLAGRTNPDAISLFKQNSDQGVGFMALARLAYECAREAGIGLEV
jgi:alanine dehydrogenase